MFYYYFVILVIFCIAMLFYFSCLSCYFVVLCMHVIAMLLYFSYFLLLFCFTFHTCYCYVVLLFMFLLLFCYTFHTCYCYSVIIFMFLFPFGFIFYICYWYFVLLFMFLLLFCCTFHTWCYYFVIFFQTLNSYLVILFIFVFVILLHASTPSNCAWAPKRGQKRARPPGPWKATGPESEVQSYLRTISGLSPDYLRTPTPPCEFLGPPPPDLLHGPTKTRLDVALLGIQIDVIAASSMCESPMHFAANVVRKTSFLLIIVMLLYFSNLLLLLWCTFHTFECYLLDFFILFIVTLLCFSYF